MEKFTVQLPEIPDREWNISDFGAVSGGRISNTEAIRRTIDEAGKCGGGKVIIPPGIWLTGPVELKSNINLHLCSGAVLLFRKDKSEYPLYVSDYEGMEAIRARSPIYAEHASNLAVTGSGIIDGGGEQWRPVKRFKVTERQWESLLQQSPYTVEERDGAVWMPSETFMNGYLREKTEVFTPEELEAAELCWDYFRPVLVHLYDCSRILIEGVTLQNSPAWNLHPCFCEHITIRNAVVRNPYYAQNGDGLDLESCRYAEISNTTFDVGDDAICMKSGKGAKARETKAPTEYVSIHDCIVYHGHGGFVVGSEMSRGVRKVWVKNCSFLGTDVGIRFKSAVGRGGVVEDIEVDSIQMVDIEKEAVIFTMSYVLNYGETEGVEEVHDDDIPYFRNIVLRNIHCSGSKTGLKVQGMEWSRPTIDQIVLEDSVIAAKKDMEIVNAGEIHIERVDFV